MRAVSHSPASARLLLAIAYLGFISLGLPDTLIGVAWPSVRDGFGRQQADLAWIFIGAGVSYFLSSLCTGRLLKRLGVGVLLAASSLLVAGSGFGYAVAPVWGLFAACSLLHGLGSGAIDAGLNHYVAHHFSARHMSWLHACYSLGATLGPVIMTSVLVWSQSWRAGYFTVASFLLLLSILFAFTRRRWDAPGTESSAEPLPVEVPGERPTAAPKSDAGIGMRETLRHPVVWMHVVLFFIYTGLEVTVGQWSFTILTEARGVAKETAGVWVTIYWGSIGVGRVLFGFVVERLGIDRLLRLSMLGTVLGAGAFAAGLSGIASACALALIGLGLAAIYPCLMTRTPQRLGTAHAAHAIGYQVSAAMLGAAALPSVSGMLAQHAGLEIVALAALVMAIALSALHEAVLRFTRERKPGV